MCILHSSSLQFLQSTRKFQSVAFPTIKLNKVRNKQDGYIKIQLGRVHTQAQSEFEEKYAQQMNGVQKGVCVVVGGGPAGLATAIMLAQQGWKNIKVLEQSSEDQIADTTKSYQYAMHGRGQLFLQSIDANEDLKKVGLFFSETSGISQIKPDGQIQFIGSMKNLGSQKFPPYLCLRSDVIELLLQKIKSRYQNIIELNFNTACKDLQQNSTGINLTYQVQDQNSIEVQPQLIVGCDGKNSIVRQKLMEIHSNEKFKIQQVDGIPAAGSRFKILQLPEGFYVDGQKRTKIDNLVYYLLAGKSNNEKNKLSVQSLPSAKTLQQKKIRLVSVAASAKNSNLWTLDTAEKVLDFFEEEFPQINVQQVISYKEAEKFAKSKGGIFPIGSYCENAAYICNNNNNNQYSNYSPPPSSNSTPTLQGVVLVGDSLHNFPPYIGQGVNSAFEDILVLADQLQKYENDFRKALQKYEELRQVDSKSLLEVQQRPKLSKYTLFQIWFVSLLNQKFPMICPPNDLAYINDEGLRYSEAQRLIQRNKIIYMMYLGFAVLFPVLCVITSYNLIFS